MLSAVAAFQSVTEKQLCAGMAAFCCTTIPVHGSCMVLRYALAKCVHHTKPELRLRLSKLSQNIPFKQCRLVVRTIVGGQPPLIVLRNGRVHGEDRKYQHKQARYQ